MTAINKFIALFIIIIVFSCTSKKKDSITTPTTSTTETEIKDNSKPDPTIEVKDDFTQLTKSDEEKEDKTHMDMSYYPSNYALNKAQGKEQPLLIRVIYSRPHKRDRPVIFGDSNVLVNYGKLWRLGANESTEIEFTKPVIINNKKINAGRYSLYAIPNKKTWTIIVNSNLYTWGDYNYDPTKDVVRAEALVTDAKFSLETFLIYFQKTNQGCNMILSWDTVVASLPITIP